MKKKKTPDPYDYHQQLHEAKCRLSCLRELLTHDGDVSMPDDDSTFGLGLLLDDILGSLEDVGNQIAKAEKGKA